MLDVKGKSSIWYLFWYHVGLEGISSCEVPLAGKFVARIFFLSRGHLFYLHPRREREREKTESLPEATQTPFEPSKREIERVRER